MTEVKDLKRFVDDRGVLDQIFDSDLPFEVKRIYFVQPTKGIVRGMHGHKKEWKVFCVLSGSAKFLVVPVNFDNRRIVFVLNAKKPEIIIISPNSYNGFVALEDNTILLGLSSATLKESLKDDFRKDWDAFGDFHWKVKPR